MSKNTVLHYHKIAQAIEYLETHFKEQPSLGTLAEQVHLSPHHFQKLFKDWAGVSPKKYIQFLSVNYAKSLLQQPKQNLFNTALETGLSGTGRLHDLFVNLEGMTPGEYKNGGESLVINYQFAESTFGEILIASTPKGICHLAFTESKTEALDKLKTEFPRAEYKQTNNAIIQKVQSLFQNLPEQIELENLKEIKLHLKGSEFQLKVWQALLTIPQGELSTYGGLAKKIGNAKASRAVGTAIGSNPIAYLIPCHRVIQSSGKTGGYRWNPIRKKAMLAWEAAVNSEL